MTTTVKVYAHCAEDKEVEIVLHGTHEQEARRAVIQDGEEWSDVVYDTRAVVISERNKRSD